MHNSSITTTGKVLSVLDEVFTPTLIPSPATQVVVVVVVAAL